jgi:hypothetical protein
MTGRRLDRQMVVALKKREVLEVQMIVPFASGPQPSFFVGDTYLPAEEGEEEVQLLRMPNLELCLSDDDRMLLRMSQ